VAKVKTALDRRRFEKVADRIGPGRVDVLDVGGGDGEVVSGLISGSGANVRATVVDFDEQSIDRARARGLDAWAGRFEDFAPEQRFNVVLMLNLIEHVAEPVDVLAKAAEVLTPDGLLWLQTPNFRSLDARIFRQRSWAGLHCPRHWTVFSEAGLRIALARAGLRPIEVKRTQGGSFWAASILGIRRSRRLPSPEWTPLVNSPAYAPLAAMGAAFDFATRSVRSTSQTVVLAARD
jgi:SAM-dependent methyltransferase